MRAGAKLLGGGVAWVLGVVVFWVGLGWVAYRFGHMIWHSTSVMERVEYYNPSTGTRRAYRLRVDRDRYGEVESLRFGNGGYLDAADMTVAYEGGMATYIGQGGAEYTVEDRTDDEARTDDEDGPNPY